MCEHFLWCQGHRTFVVLEVQNFCSARGKGLLEVPGAHTNCSAMTTVLGPIRSDKSFIFAMTPLLIGV